MVVTMIIIKNKNNDNVWQIIMIIRIIIITRAPAMLL